ncbi:MAG: hypothetical protein AABY93_04495 [Bacteroidota bacterium]
MTNERKKTILILSATLIVGILIGLLIPGFFHKYQGNNQRGRGVRDRSSDHKKEWFVRTIYNVVKPDSAQAKQIKPITDWASQQIAAIEISSNSQMSAILDSVKIQLKPILTAEQQQRLTEFHSKAQGRWKGKEKGRR